MAKKDPFTKKEQTIWTPGSRSDVADRRVRNTVLRNVYMDIPATEDDYAEGALYPSPKAEQRDNRLRLYDDIYRGDLTRFVPDACATAIFSNYAARIVEAFTQLLLSTNPPENICGPAGGTIADTVKTGRGYTVRVDDDILHLEPWDVMRHEDGEHLIWIDPYVSAESDSGEADMCRIYVIPHEPGLGMMWYAELRSESSYPANAQYIGRTLHAESIDGAWHMANRPPQRKAWGTSQFDILIPLLPALALAMTGNTEVLNANMFPILAIAAPQASDDAFTKSFLRDYTHDGAGWTRRQTQQLVENAFSTNDKIWLPDGTNINAIKYIEYGGNLGASFDQIDMLKQEIAIMVALVGLLNDTDNRMGEISGSAVAQLSAPLHWSASTLWREVEAAYAWVLGGDSGWQNPFEAEVEEAPDPMDNMPGGDTI